MGRTGPMLQRRRNTLDPGLELVGRRCSETEPQRARDGTEHCPVKGGDVVGPPQQVASVGVSGQLEPGEETSLGALPRSSGEVGLERSKKRVAARLERLAKGSDVGLEPASGDYFVPGRLCHEHWRYVHRSGELAELLGQRVRQYEETDPETRRDRGRK